MLTFALIPGLLSDARVWQPLAMALAQRGAVHHVDLTQMGTIESAAAEVLASTDGPLVVIGHSLGGRVAFEVARQGAERVMGVVVADTGHEALRPGEKALRLDRIARAHADLPGLVDDWLPPMLAPRNRGTALADDLRAMALGVGAEAHERQVRALIARPDARRYLGALTPPVLLLAGSEDGWSPPDQHEAMAALLPHAEVQVVDGAGHFLPVEEPDALIRIIERWLDAHSLGA